MTVHYHLSFVSSISFNVPFLYLSSVVFSLIFFVVFTFCHKYYSLRRVEKKERKLVFSGFECSQHFTTVIHAFMHFIIIIVIIATTVMI